MMNGRTRKDPAEELVYTEDFAADASQGAISLCPVTARNAKTGANSTADIIDGVSGITEGRYVSQKIKGGAHGDVHILEFKATTTAGMKLDREIELHIVEE